MTLAECRQKLAGTGKGSSSPWIRPTRRRPPSAGSSPPTTAVPEGFLYSAARDLHPRDQGGPAQRRLVAFGGKTVKNVSGYDMTKLMIGSLGALGLSARSPRNSPRCRRPRRRSWFPSTIWRRPRSLTKKLLHSVLLPSAMELMDANSRGRNSARKARYLAAFAWRGFEEAVERQIAEIGEMGEEGRGRGRDGPQGGG